MALDRSKLATTNPETTVEGGSLPSGFWGTVSDACYRVRQNDAGRKWLSSEFHITPDEGSDLDARYFESGVEARWAAGALTSFAPSKDGEDVVPWQEWSGDESDADGITGYYALRTGSKAGLNKNTNWVVFSDRARDTGDARVKALTTESVDIRDWVGLHGYWERLPQPTRDFADQADRKAGDMLCLTKVTPGTAGTAAKGAGKSASTSKGATAPAAVSKANGASDTGAIDDELSIIVMQVLKDADGPVHKLKLTKPATEGIEAPADRKARMNRVVEPAFLKAGAEQGLWSYNADNGQVSPA